MTCVAACGAPPSPAPEPPPSSSAAPIDPGRIDRARAEAPDGYEVAGVAGRVGPATWWGLGGQWSADPPQCGVLAGAAADEARGWSASGAGGIVYATVAPSPPPTGLAECDRWTVAAAKTSGAVTMTPPPAVVGAQTVAMATATTTVVEGGTETRSHADTASAYLDGHVVTVTVVTDPGSPNPQLGQQFATDLLVNTVAALRG